MAVPMQISMNLIKIKTTTYPSLASRVMATISSASSAIVWSIAGILLVMKTVRGTDPCAQQSTPAGTGSVTTTKLIVFKT